MNQPRHYPRHVLILGLDTFARKNVAQVRALEAEGYSFTVVTNDQRNDSERIFGAQGYRNSRLVVSGGSFAGKLGTAWTSLRSRRFNHVELYAAGRMALFYLLMIRMLRQKYIVVERGDIGCLSDYGMLIRISIKLAYRWADGILYKETYMEAPLRRATRAPLFFVPNSVEQQVGAAPQSGNERRPIDFLWVNRIVPQRRAAWVLSAARGPLSSKKFTMLGFEDRDNLPPLLKAEQEKIYHVSSDNIARFGFIDPEPYYRQARFFCLPAEVVFGNNSLLEAMSWGIVPIVTAAPGVELIVEDGLNGIVTAFNESAYHDGLARAAALDEQDWQRLSEAAIATVRGSYSISAWTQKMIAVYHRITAT